MKTKSTASLKAISGLSATPEYSPAAIRKLMARHNLNECAFATLMNVGAVTVRQWVSGEAKPCGPSRRLMQIYDTAPEITDALVNAAEQCR